MMLKKNPGCVRVFAAAVTAVGILYAPECAAATRREIYESYRKELRNAWRTRDYLLPPWLDRSLNTFALTGLYLTGLVRGVDFIDPRTPPPDLEAERRLAPEPPVKLPGLAERVPLTNYAYHVTSAADLDKRWLIFGSGRVRLNDCGEPGESPLLRLYPMRKRGEMLAVLETEAAVFFYDYGSVWHSCDFPVWRKPDIRRGNAILKCGRLYRVHCGAEKIDSFIYIEDQEKH